MSVPPPVTASDASIEDVASGQRMIILAIVLNIAANILVREVGLIWGLIGIAAIVLAIVGLMRLADGLHYSAGAKIGLVILMLIPVVSLITLLIVNVRANRSLREAGYKVGLFGARRP
jgi:hypothetical protein